MFYQYSTICILFVVPNNLTIKSITNEFLLKLTAADIQKKIENLRTYFAKECGKESEVKPKSGSGLKTPFKSSWPYYKDLAWLRDHIAYSDSASNLFSLPQVIAVDEGNDVGEVNSDFQNQNHEEMVHAPSRKRPKQGEDRLVKAAEEMVKTMASFGKPSERPTLQPITEDELFGKLIAKKLCKIPEGETKDDLKLHIQMLLKQAQYCPGSPAPIVSGKEPFAPNMHN